MAKHDNIFNRVTTYKAQDCGKFGKAFESALTHKACKAQGKVDWTHLKIRYEVKTGATKLFNVVSLVGGTRKVLYVPVPVVESDGTIDPYRQEGFIFTAEAFIEAVKEAGLYREHKDYGNGTFGPAIQTFYVRDSSKAGKSQSGHGKKYDLFLDCLYSLCECTLEELLSCGA